MISPSKRTVIQWTGGYGHGILDSMSSRKQYSLIIVDDEPAIRQGLVQYVDWDDLGFKVRGAMEDGREAMEALKTDPVDVVLTDIRMAEVSGLDLAEYIHNNLPRTRVLIMSGFKEFDYARRALAYNVRDYLLKPVEITELKRVFLSLYEEISEESALRVITERLSLNGGDIIKILHERNASGKVTSDEDLEELLHDVINPDSEAEEIYDDYIAAIIGKAKAYMRENCGKDISLDDVASQVYLSPVYFSRFFKEKTGDNFINYLTALRMKEAEALLLTGRHKILEISQMVGYRSSKYFSRVFKGYYGLTPTEYLHRRLGTQ